MSLPSNMTIWEHTFARHGCHGFWEPEYVGLSARQLLEVIKPLDNRLDQVRGSLMRAIRWAEKSLAEESLKKK